MTKLKRPPTLTTTRRKWSKRVKELALKYDNDPFDGLGDFEPVPTVKRAVLAVARAICAWEGFNPTPAKTAKPAAKKKAKAQPKKTTKKRVAKQSKQAATPAIEVLFQSPEGNKHWLPLVPENSELLLIGWTIVDADDMSAVNAMYGEAM